MIHAIFYTDSKYRGREIPVIRQMYDAGFDTVTHYPRELLTDTVFYIENKEILDMERGGGYWLWKPFIILDLINKISDNDTVFYMDAGDDIRPGTIDKIKNVMLDSDYMISGHRLRPPNLAYTKRDCFILMGCDNCESRSARQVEAGTLVFKKTPAMISFLEEWLHYCKDKHILTDIPNIHGTNFIGFNEHRQDQSILSLLVTKYKMEYSELLYSCINYNAFTL